MNIRKIGSNELQIQDKNNNKIVVKIAEDGYLTANFDKNGVDLTKPGEYEYEHIHFIAQEVTDEKYKSKVNLLNVILEEGISLLVLTNQFELDKAVLSRLASPQLVVCPLSNNGKLKSLIKKFNPYSVVFVDGLLGGKADEKDIKSLKSEFNFVPSVENKYKFNAKDFAGEEDVITAAYILE